MRDACLDVDRQESREFDKSGRIRSVCLLIDDSFGEAFQFSQCGIQRDDALAVIKKSLLYFQISRRFWIGETPCHMTSGRGRLLFISQVLVVSLHPLQI
jgi:hypothetical protein